MIGQSLETLCGAPMEVGRFLRLAIAIATALAQAHQQKVIHLDVSPARILVDEKTGQAVLGGLAERPSRWGETAARQPPGRTEAIYGYLSPEQTGRMSQPVDHRSDLYALGMTFYKMLTGVLPFQARDAMEWFHCHIARQPRPVGDLLPAIPPMVSAMVMKLIRKSPEARYQTAHGLRFDLEKCLAQWRAGAEIQTFSLGQGDISERLLIPQKLFGRQGDEKTLHDAFTRVAQGGTPEIVMIAGYAGIGKTALVRQLYRQVIARHGLFISGKFDQYKRDIPYATMAEAFQELVQQILSESEERIAVWKQRIQEAVGINGQLIADIIGQVELIIGRQPPVPALAPNEAENRFNMVFSQFIRVFASAEQPLVVFLDDLQWVDPASLRLLARIASEQDIKHLLLIGAYRDNEVDPLHPLSLMLDALAKGLTTLSTITLAPLSPGDLGRMLSETLRAEEAKLAPLTSLIHEKTGGNPFFAIQLLMMLHDEKLVAFDWNLSRWTWDIAGIQAKSHASNVVDLMVRKLERLSPPARRVLTLASCVGNKFDLPTLATLAELTPGESRRSLDEALGQGLLLPLAGQNYSFLHDRVQQAAYSLIPREDRARLHLRVGRLLLERYDAEPREEMLFDLVNQINAGAQHISDPAEKLRLVELNLLAGKKAKSSIAYSAALAYLSLGSSLLDPGAWDERYALAFDLHRELALAEYLNGNFQNSKDLIHLLLGKARDDMARAKLYNILIVQHTLVADYQEAITAGRQALRLLGVDLPAEDLQGQLDARLLKINAILAHRQISSLVDDPEMTDPRTRVVMETLAALLVPARYTDYLLFVLLSATTVNLSLEFGPIAKSPVGYSAFGMYLSFKLNKFKDGYEFGQLAIRLSERFNDLSQKCQACFVQGNYLSPWVRHLKWADQFNEAGYAAGVAVGELQWTGYTLAYRPFTLFYRGEPLAQVGKDLPDLLRFTQKTKNQWAIDTLLGLRLALANLCGPAPGEPPDLASGGQDEPFLRACHERRSFGALGRHAVLMAQIHYLLRRLPEALRAVARARELLGFYTNSISVAELNFYHSLILAALWDTASEQDRRDYRQTIIANQRQAEIWAGNCPENFLHQYHLVQAELARLEGDDLLAMGLYEQAMAAAQQNGFLNDLALSFELASRYYRRRGHALIADSYLRESLDRYQLWGATNKAAQLRGEHPWLAAEPPAPAEEYIGDRFGSLDAISVVKASQAISGEIVLADLVETLMRIVLENSGAQRGCLILSGDGGLAVKAEALVRGEAIMVRWPDNEPLDSQVPLAVINYVSRTHEVVVLEDAAQPSRFPADPYLSREKLGSVLCLPLMRQAKLIGLLYLENNLVAGAFSAQRMAVLELLAAQAAISLENAALYLARSQAEEALRQSEKRYRAIFDNSGTAMIFIEDDMTIAMCNQEFEKLSKYSRAEVEGRLKWTIFVADPGELERMKGYHRRRGEVPQAAPQSYEFLFKDREGDLKNLVISVAVMPGKKQRLASLLDITERKRAEVALRASEERYRTLFERLEDDVLVMEAEGPEAGRIVDVNEATVKTHGYTREELLTMKVSDLDAPEAASQVPDRIQRMLAGEWLRFEASHVRKDGSLIPLDVSAGCWEYGGRRRIIAFDRDISERKRAERERGKLEAQLRQSQKMEAVGTLAGGIAHDFNNLLNVILGFAELAQDHALRGKSPDQDISQIVNAARRASQLVQQILTFSRRAQTNMNPLNLNSAVSRLVKILERTIPKMIRIETKLAPDLKPVNGDANQMELVLLNLANNAVDAMGDHGRLVIETQNMELDAAYCRQNPGAQAGPYVLLMVSDNGQGMDQETRQHIFEPFFTTKGLGQGTGLGMSTVYGVVKDHGGLVTCYSELGLGTTMKIYLPALQGQSPAPGSEEPLAAEQLRGSETILVVDDEPALREMACLALEEMGYHALTAGSGEEALDLYRQKGAEIGLVVLDLGMPGMGGHQALREIMALDPHARIIIASGYSANGQVKASLESGAAAYVAKPFRLADLLRTVRRVLDQ